MKPNPNVRQAGAAVLARIEVSEGEVTLVMQDVESAPTQDPVIWQVVRLYTQRSYPARSFAELSLEPKEYEEVGFNLVNRLCALNKLEQAEQRPPKARHRRKKQQ